MIKRFGKINFIEIREVCPNRRANTTNRKLASTKTRRLQAKVQHVTVWNVKKKCIGCTNMKSQGNKKNGGGSAALGITATFPTVSA